MRKLLLGAAFLTSFVHAEISQELTDKINDLQSTYGALLAKQDSLVADLATNKGMPAELAQKMSELRLAYKAEASAGKLTALDNFSPDATKWAEVKAAHEAFLRAQKDFEEAKTARYKQTEEFKTAQTQLAEIQAALAAEKDAVQTEAAKSMLESLDLPNPTTLQAEIQSLEAKNSEIQQAQSQTLDLITKSEAQIRTFDKDIVNKTTSIGVALQAVAAKDRPTIKASIQAQIDKIKEAKDAKSKEIEALRAKVSENTENLRTLEASLIDKKAQLEELSKPKTITPNRLEELKGKLAPLAQSVKDFAPKLSAAKKQTTGLYAKQTEMLNTFVTKYGALVDEVVVFTNKLFVEGADCSNVCSLASAVKEGGAKDVARAIAISTEFPKAPASSLVVEPAAAPLVAAESGEFLKAPASSLVVEPGAASLAPADSGEFLKAPASSLVVEPGAAPLAPADSGEFLKAPAPSMVVEPAAAVATKGTTFIKNSKPGVLEAKVAQDDTNAKNSWAKQMERTNSLEDVKQTRSSILRAETGAAKRASLEPK